MKQLILHFVIAALTLLNSLALNARDQQLIINEIMAANVSYMLDNTYNYGGWMELYNCTENSIDLAGYHVTDDITQPDKYTFPKNMGSIEAGEYKIVFFDNNDQDPRQVNFKLDCDGAALYLLDDKKNIIDEMVYGFAYPLTSYARESDGDLLWSTCITPTPGKSNNNSQFTTKRTPKPTTGIQPGIYSGNISVKLSGSGTIRYTTDGSEPTTKSAIWSGTKNISATTVIRARAYQKGYIPSEILTCTYIIEKIRHFDLPIISITTDPDNLWNDSIGIYCIGTNGVTGNGVSYPANWNRDWRRPANIEIINNPHDSYLSQQCDIGIGGGYSRAYPEKSIEINAEKKYEGKNSFDARIFAQKPHYRFKSLNLRNSGNDFYRTMMWDGAQQCLYANNVDVEYQAYQPAIHYINGEYYGIINIRERSNHHHAYSNWGYEKENLDLVQNSASGNTFLGERDTFNRLLGLLDKASNDATYNEICNIIDIDEFINYIVIQSFAGNSDWMSNNVKFYRSQNHDGRFRWILFDLDAGFSNTKYDQFTATDRSGLSNTRAYTGQIFQALKRNSTFREKFINHATAVIGGIIRPERVNPMADSIAALIINEIPYQQQRWSNNYNISSYISSFKNFADKRRQIYATQVADHFSLGTIAKIAINPDVKTALYLNETEIPTGKFDGYIHTERNQTLRVEVPYGYKFDYWTINKSSSTLPFSDNSAAQRKPSYINPTLKLEFEKGTYSITTKFTKLDSLHGHLVPAIRINELGANKEIVRNDRFEKSDWIELYNLTDTMFDIAGLYISNSEENPKLYRFPANSRQKTRIPPHGYCILWADEEPDKRELHLPFKLPSSGGKLILSAYDENNGTLLWRDEIVYTPHDNDRSFGRYPDGSNKLHLLHRPTPANTNLYSSYNRFVANDTVTGYHINEKTSITTPVTEGRTVIKTTYYNLAGQEMKLTYDELPAGIYIRRTIYDNHDVESEKILKR